MLKNIHSGSMGPAGLPTIFGVIIGGAEQHEKSPHMLYTYGNQKLTLPCKIAIRPYTAISMSALPAWRVLDMQAQA